MRENAVIDWDGMVHPDRFQEGFERTARRTADPSTTLRFGRDDKGRAVTFRKGGDLDGRSLGAATPQQLQIHLASLPLPRTGVVCH